MVPIPSRVYGARMVDVSSPGGVDSASTDESAHADEAEADVMLAAKSKLPGRFGLAAGALIAVGAVVTMVFVVNSPWPDATLLRTGELPTVDVLAKIAGEPYFRVEGSTLRVHESFEGWNVFTGSNFYGAPCLVVISDDEMRIDCTPAPAEPIADTFPRSQSDDRMVRFILNGDVVEVWVYPHPEVQ